MKNLLKKYLKYLKIFILLEWKFNVPKKEEYLIYHRSSKENLEKLLKINMGCINYTKEINILIFLISLLRKPFKSYHLNYVYNYIKFTRSKFIFTFIDNDHRFYLLKNKLNSEIFISIQGGYRNSNGDFFDKNFLLNDGSYKCDHIFTMNDQTGKEFKKIVNTKTTSIGSFFSNSSKIKKKKI